jgi:mannose-1-phosphate guanylyltransferase
VAHDPSRIVLLALEAQYPEVEYGYIVTREEYNRFNIWGLRDAARFVEKPNAATAQHLTETGGLWNTMTMVFKVRTVLDLMQRHCSESYRKLSALVDAIGTADELRTTNEIYRTLNPVNFSKEFLENVALASPKTIAVLPISQVLWSDWGSAQRLLQVQELLAEVTKNSQHQRTSPFENTASIVAAR